MCHYQYIRVSSSEYSSMYFQCIDFVSRTNEYDFEQFLQCRVNDDEGIIESVTNVPINSTNVCSFCRNKFQTLF